MKSETLRYGFADMMAECMVCDICKTPDLAQMLSYSNCSSGIDFPGVSFVIYEAVFPAQQFRAHQEKREQFSHVYTDVEEDTMVFC